MMLDDEESPVTKAQKPKRKRAKLLTAAVLAQLDGERVEERPRSARRVIVRETEVEEEEDGARAAEEPREVRIYLGKLPGRASDGLIRQFVEETLGNVRCEVTVVRKEIVFAFVTTTCAGAVDMLDGADFLGQKVVASRAFAEDRGESKFRKNVLAAHLEQVARQKGQEVAKERQAEREKYLESDEARAKEAERRLATAAGHLGHGFTSCGTRPRLHSGYAHFGV